ncbi:hypothetical protein [Chryseobacterium gossypii]|uniref:hypothetical protein n=1 Tax=Chryseobacterium gossypii TaxID=3231602 RepID=UPI0035260BD6
MMKPNRKIARIYVLYLIINILFLSCHSRKPNYISYYNKVNEIDSIYRMAKQPEKARILYRKLFRKYPPKNQERIEELETYIRLSDRYGKNSHTKKDLYTLIPLMAPYWKDKKNDPEFLSLYKKYGIDNIEIEQKITKWKKSLNKQLIDSFTVAFIRDKAENRLNDQLREINDRKNAKLLKWTFENYGFPSLQKIGLWGNNNVFMPMEVLLLHMADVAEYRTYFKTKMIEYVKSGDCFPRDYAGMLDRQNMHLRLPRNYAVYQGYEDIEDSAQIDRNRKNLGVPSIRHRAKIARDFYDSLKLKQK